MSVKTRGNRRATGSYYTCSSIADYIATWAIDKNTVSLLEPSFGDGGFLDAARNRFAELGVDSPVLCGVELQEKPFKSYANVHADTICYNQDYMDFVAPCGFDSIIGNPPYIRLKNLDIEGRNKTIQTMRDHGIAMPANGSMWMPFVIHAAEMLNPNGRLGFILPYEVTYVRYAFGLWSYLASKFKNIRLLRIHRDFFPDVDVETVLLLADGKGGTTENVTYELFQSAETLLLNLPVLTTNVGISSIINMEKPFERKMISGHTQELLKQLTNSGKLLTLKNDCKFKIGYVSGSKKFFNPDKETIEKYEINESHLIPCIVNAKDMNSCKELGLDALSGQFRNVLFYPSEFDRFVDNYIHYGESIGIEQGYKCRSREPWYLTPNLEVPDVILTVFGDVPKLICNTGRYVVSNSLLSGVTGPGISAKELVCRWYNSLTLLMIELTIHSLGGGTFVFIPGEVDKLSIIGDFPKDRVNELFSMFDGYAVSNDVEAIYELGDELVLKNIYGLTSGDITSIRNDLKYLRDWRRPEERRG